MLFNSYDFIFLFLPGTLLSFLLVNRLAPRFNAHLVVCASLLFYGYWQLGFVPLLALSIGANFLISKQISRRGVLPLAIAFNLLALVYFKYMLFLAGLIGMRALAEDTFGAIVLPLAISFYTFHQISFLVDLKRRSAAPPRFMIYAAYVLLFPQLIAGPIVRYHQIDRQLVRLQQGLAGRRLRILISSGVALFAIGLFKKVVLADSLALVADPVFARADATLVLSTSDAWLGALAYTFQLYFDFSGYSDMALGLGRMFGLFLPINFYSPYRSATIQQFWRRWHMSLSYFVRDYIYVPLGGSRLGQLRRALNLMLCFTIIGIWHGAGLTFLLWGVCHGILVVASPWIEAVTWRISGALKLSAKLVERCLLVPVTFALVVIGWVVFRAPTLDDARAMYEAMFAFRGGHVVFHEAASYPSAYLLVAAAAAICFVLPNSIDLLGSRTHALLQGMRLPRRRSFAASLARRVMLPILAGVALYLAVASIRGLNTSFLYFNF